MISLILTATLIQWLIPIKLDLDTQARAEQLFKANEWCMHHWPTLDTDSPGGGNLFASEGAMEWKKIAIKNLGMNFIADLVCLETENQLFPFKGNLQLIGTFKNLRMLSIDFSRIAPPVPAQPECIHLAFLKNLKELRTLSLTCYQKDDLNALFKESQTDFPFLKMLVLHQCQNLKGDTIPGLFSCPNLLSLDLSGCDLKTIPVMTSQKPFKLRHLSLDCKTLDTNIWDYVANCPDLKELSVDYPDFTGKELAKISGLQKLTKLRIYPSNLTDQDLTQLVLFKKLKSLKIGGNKLSNQGSIHLAQQGDLEDLTLQGAGFTDESLMYLKKLKNLRRITLLSTGITAEGQEFLINHNKEVIINKGIDVDISYVDDFLDSTDFPPLFHFGCLYHSPANR